MVARGVKLTSALLLVAAMPMYVGCACKGARTAYAKEKTSVRLTADRMGAEVGECFAMVYEPPRFETVSEKVCVKEASEVLELVPAQYEWVEERVCVKDATTELELIPAQFKMQQRTVEIEPGSTGWIKHENANCDDKSGNPVSSDVFCLEQHPPKVKTVSFQEVAEKAHCREVTVPAEYQTIRRQKLVHPATTRRVTIPAEFETIEKTVKVAGGEMDWQRVVCEGHLSTQQVTEIENSLLASGYDPGTPNGELGESDWIAIRSFQEDNGLGMGALTYQTLDRLGVKAD